MTLITEHSFFDLGKIGIPTAYWEEYYDDSQLNPGSDYLIGVVENGNYSDYVTSSVVKGHEKQLDFIRELYRQYGSQATVIIQEVPEYVETGTLTIKPGDVEVYGELTDDEKMEMSRWAVLLSRNFLFEKEIVIIWGKDSEGRLMVRSIN